MLPHDSRRAGASLIGQLEMAVSEDMHEVVSFHARHGLRHRRATLMQALRDPGAQWNDPLLLELIDRAEVHLGGVDQVAHVSPIVFARASCQEPAQQMAKSDAREDP